MLVRFPKGQNMLHRFLTAAIAFVAITFSTYANAEFATFDKAKFEALLQSKATVVVHTHEWW